MKCNNTHCKYYKPAEHIRLLWLGTVGKKEEGCKYSYCKKNKKKRRTE